MGKTKDPYKVSDGYLLYANCLCITKNLREKVMIESHAHPYVGHCGIATTTQAIETYFYWPSLKKMCMNFYHNTWYAKKLNMREESLKAFVTTSCS